MNILFLLKEGIVNLRRARLAALIAIFSMALSLTLLSVFGVVGENLRQVFNRVYRQIEIEVFLDPTLSLKKIESLRLRIDELPETRTVRYISPDEALKEFQKSFGEDLTSVLDHNPLPPSLRVIIQKEYSSPELLEQFTTRLEEMDGVDEILYQKEVIRFIHKYFNLAFLLAVVLAVFLVAVIVILVFNTIRLSIHSRRELIEIMQLVGATDRFIKSPFVLEGIIQGVIGGALACGFSWILIKLIRGILFTTLAVPGQISWMLIAFGIVLGWMGSSISVNKYLK